MIVLLICLRGTRVNYVLRNCWWYESGLHGLLGVFPVEMRTKPQFCQFPFELTANYGTLQRKFALRACCERAMTKPTIG